MATANSVSNAIIVPPLYSGMSLTNPDGTPHQSFIIWWNLLRKNLNNEFGALEAALAASNAAANALTIAHTAQVQVVQARAFNVHFTQAQIATMAVNNNTVVLTSNTLTITGSPITNASVIEIEIPSSYKPDISTWIPLSLGVEPGEIVTDGAGGFITVAYD